MKTRIITFAVCAFAVLAGVVSNAQAADHSMETADGLGPFDDPAGRMWFNEYGDVVTLCDIDDDGEKPILHVALDDPYGRDRYTMVVGGEGRCITRKAAMGGRYNLPENRRIGFLICVYPDGYCRAKTWLNDH